MSVTPNGDRFVSLTLLITGGVVSLGGGGGAGGAGVLAPLEVEAEPPELLPKLTVTPVLPNGTVSFVRELTRLELPLTPIVALPELVRARKVTVATSPEPLTGLVLPFWILTTPLPPPSPGVAILNAPPL